MDQGTAAPAAPSSAGGNTAASPPTFESVFAADAASPAADPSTSAQPSPEAPAADGSEATPGSEDRSPYIPRERFDQVNQRMQAAEAKAKALAWAESVDQQQLAQMAQWYQRAQQDTDGFLTETFLEHQNPIDLLNKLVSRIQGHAVHGPALASFAAKQLAARRGEQEPQPDLPIQLDDGRVVKVYTAEQQAKRETWLQKQWLAQARQEMQPALETAAQLKTEREAAKQAAIGQQWADDTLKTVYAWPGMDNPDNRKLVGQAVQQANPQGVMATERAMWAAYVQHVIPTLGKAAESKLLDNLQQRAHASTGVNPGSAAPTTTTRPRDFNDPSLTWK